MRGCRFVVRFVALSAMFVAGAVHAQLLAAKGDSFYSNVLGQKRAIEVFLPQESAKDATQRYETIYVLDGDWNSKVVVDVVTFMRQVGVMPPAIVVSVPNFFDDKGVNSRDHDLTPTVVADPRYGGAAAFLSFLKTELIPYVDRHYPANGTNLIHGHSFGGLFLIYALIKDPTLFDGYLILDPAMSWDNHALDAPLDSTLGVTPAKGKSIYIAARSGSAFEGMGVASIEPIFQHKAPRELHWKIAAYPGETHDSLKLKGTYDALKFAYEGFTTDRIEVVPSDGILIKGKPMVVHVGNERFDIHYTTDGSLPDAASPRAGETIAISDPEQTRFRLLSSRGTFDRDIPHNLRSGQALSPETQVAQVAEKVWHFALYPSKAWPSLAKATPFRAGDTTRGMDLDKAGRDEFAGSLQRTLDIPEDGYYVFRVEASDKARMSLSDKVLVQIDATNGPREKAFVVPLRRGRYRARLDFLHPSKTSSAGLSVYQAKVGDQAWWKHELY